MENKIALIAGDGNLPVVIASRLTDMGTPPVVYSVREKVGDISKFALEVVNIVKPDIGSTIKDMKSRGVKKIIMAGLISKTLAFKPSLFDLTTQRFLASLVFRDDHSLLGALVDFLEKSGFEVMSYREIIPDLLAEPGYIAGRRPTTDEKADAEYGFSICRTLVPLSFGQTVVVNKRSVVAVEAMEGTDATLLRAGSLCTGGTVEIHRFVVRYGRDHTVQDFLPGGLIVQAVPHEVRRAVKPDVTTQRGRCAVGLFRAAQIQLMAHAAFLHQHGPVGRSDLAAQIPVAVVTDMRG